MVLVVNIIRGLFHARAPRVARHYHGSFAGRPSSRCRLPVGPNMSGPLVTVVFQCVPPLATVVSDPLKRCPARLDLVNYKRAWLILPCPLRMKTKRRFVERRPDEGEAGRFVKTRRREGEATGLVTVVSQCVPPLVTVVSRVVRTS